ncbi:SGNH/GDSL hydrolase family protein [Mucilaginibacter robiniae]|uniref:SGNH/GDSL hydrolase family protein n=1 Tax=Mucilaginibacter robiniae TaxID=2728022 RepID=A0A7L5E617_9SPHI|nr:SGNH/GDSL hydrolase family protein [Mucilaginibacter robiniae]QJD97759.1 SGNH/GDSL hydrolase family protein [Mucilaginibacter robiniae]
MRKLFYSVLSIVISLSASKAQNKVVKSTDTSHIHYMGRIMMQPDSSVQLAWSGTSVVIDFNSSKVEAWLRDEGTTNYYNVIVDGRVVNRIHPSTTKQLYTLVTGLPEGRHKLELFKRTEWAMGKTWFYGFQLDTNAVILPAPFTKKRKIEFFGNSITCGYAVIDSTGKDRGTGEFEDNYSSYAAITARHYDAEYYCTAKSGIGVMISWFPLIMPEMYNRLDANDSQSRWDFSKYTPDVVVINLFQNDSWLINMPNHEQFKARFGTAKPAAETIIQAYQKFVQTIRATYPHAQIICALGNMDATRAGAPWPGYIQQAVAGLHDNQIFTVFFPYKNTPGHPNVKEQQAMSDMLIKFIDQNIKW